METRTLRIAAFFTVLLLALTGARAAPRCASGTLLADVRFQVRGANQDTWRPLREVNLLASGDVLRYEPQRLAGDSPQKSRIALIFVPSQNGQSLEITDIIPASQWAEWAVPFRTAAVGVIFGPEGLDRKKVRNLVRDDKELIAQLAEYAEKSTRAEQLMQALANYDQQPKSQQNLEAALAGFAASWRVPVGRLDANAPADQQAAVLLRTLNPALATYDPLGGRSVTRYQQTAGLAAVVAGLFLGNSVGLAAGSTALFLNMKTMLFPDTDFRTSFLQTDGDQQVMCAPREAGKPRTRLAYLWAAKIPDAEAPALALEAPLHLAVGIQQSAPLRPPGIAPALLVRAREWQLEPREGAQAPIPVRVAAAGGGSRATALSVEITAPDATPGHYLLSALWDWSRFAIEGQVIVHDLSRLGDARVQPESADRLIAGTGPVEVVLTGANFRFVERATLRSSEREEEKTLTILPPAPDSGEPEARLRLRVETTALRPALMTLRLHQQDGQTAELPVRILPPPPTLEQLPVRANAGEPGQVLTLKGTGLARVRGVATRDAKATLELLEGTDTERRVRIRLSEKAAVGERLPLLLEVEHMHAPIVIEDAVLVARPRPRLVSVQASGATESFIETSATELLAGLPRGFLLQVAPAEGDLRAHLACEEDAHTINAIQLRSGQQSAGAALQPAGPGRFFLSLEPGMIGAPGCRLQLTLHSPEDGRSDPYPLGRVLRAPRIERFEMSDRLTPDNLYIATIEGYNLDTIQATGWNAAEGFAVKSLPVPAPGPAGRQTLEILLPWPSPSPRAPLYVFLQGEETGRRTQARL